MPTGYNLPAPPIDSFHRGRIFRRQRQPPQLGEEDRDSGKIARLGTTQGEVICGEVTVFGRAHGGDYPRTCRVSPARP